MDGYRAKTELLKKQMADYASENIAVAFSGGVDSSLLLKMACDAAAVSGNKVYGIMFQTTLHPAGDMEEAARVAAETGAEFVPLNIDVLGKAGIEKNPENRCYLCKKYLFLELQKKSGELHAGVILEGTNEDDLHVYRPGIRAVRELGIKSPLADAGFTKKEVRRLAQEYGISVSGKPSAPCLATRFPYGTELSGEAVRRVEEGEAYLREKCGFYNIRLRVHGDIARIEADSCNLEKAVNKREEIAGYLKKLGYTYVTLDLEGFRSGSMDIR